MRDRSMEVAEGALADGRRQTAESNSDGEQRGGGLQEAAHELPAGLGIYSEAIAVAAVAGTRPPSPSRSHGRRISRNIQTK